MREFNKAQHASTRALNITSYTGKVQTFNNLLHFKISKHLNCRYQIYGATVNPRVVKCQNQI